MRALLAYVTNAAGEATAAETARRAGLANIVGTNCAGSWFTYGEVMELARVASELCGDPAIGRRAGEEMFLELCEDRGVRDSLVALGSIPAAMREVLRMGMNLSAERRLEITSETPGRLVIDAWSPQGDRPAPVGRAASIGVDVFCHLSAGVYASIPAFFGSFGRVAEPLCQPRGDDRCQYVLSWSPDLRRPEVVIDHDASAKRLEQRLAAIEELHGMASDLLQDRELDLVLEKICGQAARTLEAPRLLLAVQTGAGARLHVHHRGFVHDDAAEHRGRALIAGCREFAGERAHVTEIASSGRTYGVIAAFSVGISEFSAAEVRTMTAFARHAAAALDLLVALDGASRDRDTATALLALASELSSVGSTKDITDRLVRSVKDVLHSDVVALWRWDAVRGSLVSTSCAHGSPVAPIERGTAIDVRADPDLARLLDAAGPIVHHAVQSPAPALGLLAPGAAAVVGVAPITVGCEDFGVLVAGHREVAGVDVEQHLATLRGLADHAATALENARLLEEVRHQALHDPLTGLANRTLVADRANKMLRAAVRTTASTSLLFLDLDRFKQVNDTLGHAAGDELVRQVAGRLVELARASDTVARVGGDEFIILLPETDAAQAAEVADRSFRAMRRTFQLPQGDVHISCSIGVATAPRDGSTYAALLAHADASMYRAKELGRLGVGAFATAAPLQHG